jgi:hypothetical protein
MYATSPKVIDLRHDSRFALHSMMDNDEGDGGEFAVRGSVEIVDDPDRTAGAYEAIGDLGTDRPLVLFELGIDEVAATEYDGDDVIRRPWRAG